MTRFFEYRMKPESESITSIPEILHTQSITFSSSGFMRNRCPFAHGANAVS
jgi:hypothetical protein